MKKILLGMVVVVGVLLALMSMSQTTVTADQNNAMTTIAITTDVNTSTTTANIDDNTMWTTDTCAKANNGATMATCNPANNDVQANATGQTDVGTKVAVDKTLTQTAAQTVAINVNPANTDDYRANITTTAMTAQQTAASTTWKDGAFTPRWTAVFAAIIQANTTAMKGWADTTKLATATARADSSMTAAG